MFLRRKNKSKGAANTTVLGPQTTYTLPTVEPVVIQPIVTENIVVAENPPLGNVPIQQSSDFVGFVSSIPYFIIIIMLFAKSFLHTFILTNQRYKE